MQYPSPRLRPWIAVGAGLASAGFLAWASTAGFLAIRDRGQPPIALLLCSSQALTWGLVGLGFGWLAYRSARGPSRRAVRRIRSHEWLLSYVLVTAATFVTTLELALLSGWQQQGDACPVVVIGVFWILVPIAVLCWCGAVAALWLACTRRPSFVILPDRIQWLGEPFEAELVIPCSSDRSPRVELVLSLVESFTDQGSGLSSTLKTTIWSGTTRIVAWTEGDAPETRRGAFAIDTPTELPPSFGRPGYGHYWELVGFGADPPYRGDFLVPIAFRDPVAEGLVASSRRAA